MRTLSRIIKNIYYKLRNPYYSIENVLVKEDESINSRRSQDPIPFIYRCVTEYDCEYSDLLEICELAAFFEVFIIDFFYFVFFSFSFLDFW
jgi:hypothetical protein